MFQQSIGTGRWSRMAKQEEQSKAGSKRPTSSQSVESFAGSRATGHKRLRSTSRLDEDDDATEAAHSSHPVSAALKRSSYRDALPDKPPIASTTKSNYFRLKALGQTHLYDLAPTHPRKRRHAEVSQSPAPQSVRQSTQASPPQEMLPPCSKLRRSSSVKSHHTAEETDAIIARARAAREALRDGAGFLQSEAEKTEQADPLRQSTGSQVLYDSPSLDRARLDARLRASQRNTDFGSSRRADVPAYRLRESKFVPRENYGKAIDRAREMRQSRSGNSSRPESRTETHTPTKPAETVTSQPIQAALPEPTLVAPAYQASNATFGSRFQSNVQHVAEQYDYASGQQGRYPGDLGAGEFELEDGDEDEDGDVDEDEEELGEDEFSEEEDDYGKYPNGGQYTAQQQEDNEVIELSD